jgi:hypothetical protein
MRATGFPNRSLGGREKARRNTARACVDETMVVVHARDSRKRDGERRSANEVGSGCGWETRYSSFIWITLWCEWV